jgi:hypothetical protein
MYRDKRTIVTSARPDATDPGGDPVRCTCEPDDGARNRGAHDGRVTTLEFTLDSQIDQRVPLRPIGVE